MIGTAIVSYMEPHPGYEVEFNRWYERDHFPSAVLDGPGIIAGARFVATRECKLVRPVRGTIFGDPMIGSYLSVAWVQLGKQADWDAWVRRTMKTLTDQDRLFAHRDHVHTAIYRLVGPIKRSAMPGRDGDFAGVIAVVSDRTFDDHDAAGVARLELSRTIISAAQPPRHQLVLHFVDDDPLETFARMTLPADTRYASPFFATVPGTDKYTEELW